MCLAVPAQIIALLPDDRAQIDRGGLVEEASLALVDDDVAVGDFVIVQVGLALAKLSPAEAEEALALLAAVG